MKKVLVDYRITEEEIESLKKASLEVLFSPKTVEVYEAINGHPDILIHIYEKKKIVIHKDVNSGFINEFLALGYEVEFSNSSLGNTYPDNVILNGVSIGEFFIHNLKFTDKNLKNALKDKILVNVKQGYTKCSTAVISERAIMTSDVGIAKKLKETGFDVLLLPPGDILLPNLNYGFIGGSCGLIEDKVLAFYGDLDFYAYKNEVVLFLKKHKIEPYFLRKGKLIDRGSIFLI